MPDNNIASGEGEGENTSFSRVYCLYVPRVLARVVVYSPSIMAQVGSVPAINRRGKNEDP